MVVRTIGQKTIKNQDDDGCARTDAPQKWYGQEKSEHRQAWNCLYDVGDTHQGGAQAWTTSGKNAKGHAEGDCNQSRHGDEQDMLSEQRDQLLPMCQPEVEDAHLRAQGLGLRDQGWIFHPET